MATYYGKLILRISPNGGSYHGSTAVITITKNYNRSSKGSQTANISLSSYYPNGMIRPGHKLLGFATSSSATTAAYTTTYSVSVPCNSTSGTSPTTTTKYLYAVWQELPTSGTYRGVPWRLVTSTTDTSKYILGIGVSNQTYTYADTTTQAINTWPWYDFREYIERVVFDGVVNGTGSMYGMFYGMKALSDFQSLNNFHTDNVTDLSSMFSTCSSCTTLDIAHFNTSNVTSMGSMFYRCSSLTSLDVTNFDTSSVTNMSQMFRACYLLTSIDVSNFDTSSVTNMRYMFGEDRLLTQLDLSSFDTSNVEFVASLFYACTALTTIYVSNLWDLSNVDTSSESNYNSVFYGCTNLIGGAGTLYDSSHQDYTYAHVDGGTANPGYLTLKALTILLKASSAWVSGRLFAKVNGIWQELTEGYVKVSGTWQQLT